MFYGMSGQELLGTWGTAEDAVEALLRMSWKHSGHVCFRVAYASDFHSDGTSLYVIQTGVTRDGAKMIDVVWHDSDDGPKIENWRVTDDRGEFMAYLV